MSWKPYNVFAGLHNKITREKSDLHGIIVPVGLISENSKQMYFYENDERDVVKSMILLII